jgi:hypothetical protein
MRSTRFVVAALIALAPIGAQAQFLSFGIGGGTGIGSRGMNYSTSGTGGHANVNLELKFPLLPGLRADGYFVDAPRGGVKVASALSAVISAPIPLVTPYLIVGGSQRGSKSSWNVGLGVKASAIIGPVIFAEVRRHDVLDRDIVTVGLKF